MVKYAILYSAACNRAVCLQKPNAPRALSSDNFFCIAVGTPIHECNATRARARGLRCRRQHRIVVAVSVQPSVTAPSRPSASSMSFSDHPHAW
eukprot:7384960-Prymnesium_polylepis.1